MPYIDDSVNDYLWIVIVGGFFGFFAAMGIGANDVANAFATSVGSKALTIKAAVIIALFCESGGAILLGSHVTDTIRKGIADYQCFESNPPILMFGSLCALLAIGLWLFFASWLEMPVSTTHSAVGGMIGATMIVGGAGCVTWYEPKDSFPYVGGVSGIVLSWFISPIFSGILSMIYFAITRAAILRRNDSFNKAFWSFPIFVGVTITLNLFLIIYKGAKGVGLDDIELWVALVSAFGGGLVVGLVMIPLIPVIKKCILKRLENEERIENDERGDIELRDISGGKIADSGEGKDDEELNTTNKEINLVIKSEEDKNCCKHFAKSINYEVTNDLEKYKKVKAIHDKSEKFDPRTEESFKFLQIFTAICDSFSHGANDVANAIGPFAAIYTIYRDKMISEDSDMGTDSYWILAIGGVGIMAGLAVYGYKIIRAIGVKMCMITPSRGVSIELASSTIIIIGSRLGIPLSTTHCQIGATMGVAALEDLKKCSGINCDIVWKTIVGWIITVVVVALTAALFVAFSVYAPCIRTEYPNMTFTNFTNMTTTGP
jgi:sodium-dependent phosphate transporter